jgi:hypothetical protein
MILAQALGEYGALTSLAAGVEEAAYSARLWFYGAGPETWLAMGGGALLLLWFWARRP